MKRNSTQQVEDQRLLDQVIAEQEKDAAIARSPVNIKIGRVHTPHSIIGVDYQRCGGGRRIIRKKIGGN